MLASAVSSALLGVDAYLVQVEVDVARGGYYKFIIVGLPDTSVKESGERVLVALRSQGYRTPITRILVNLAPADVRKEGPAFDLPIALGILGAQEQIPAEALKEYLITGELSLEDSLVAFERGVALVRLLNEKLAAVEQRVELLTRDADGKLRARAFDPEQE